MVDDAGSLRRSIPLNDGWEFARGRQRRKWFAYRDSGQAEVVQLPHCWNTKDTFEEGVEYYRGRGGYRRRIKVPDDVAVGCGVWELRVEGFYGTGTIWIDGQKLQTFDAQYLGLSVDVTKVMQRCSEFLVGVDLTNQCAKHVLPGNPMPDFLLYGGLAGRVNLQWKASVYVSEPSVVFRCSEVSCERAMVQTHFLAHNASDRVWTGNARFTLLDPSGETVIVDRVNLEVPPGSDMTARMPQARLDHPVLWHVDDPTLYTLRCELIQAGEVVDLYEVRCGVRSAEFVRGQGFLLNGERVELRGCNRHESMPGFGNALPSCQHREDARLLKNMGCNFVRLSHYPQHPEFLSACDEIGILVYAELASWKSVRGGHWLKNAIRQLKGMIKRDRNHPSVILWGLGNESRHRAAYQELCAVSKQLDPGRATIYAENHLYRAKRYRTLNLVDVWGSNYELDIVGEVADYCSTGCVVVSECSNQPHAHRCSLSQMAAQVEQVDRDLDQIVGQAHVTGFALWSFNDYATLRKKRYARYCGVVDAWRLPKMVGSYLRCRFSQDLQLEVFGDWSRASTEEMRTVYVLSNATSLTWSTRDGHLHPLAGQLFQSISVPFAGGPLVVRGSLDGKEVEAQLVEHDAGVRLEVQVGEPCDEGWRSVNLLVRDRENLVDEGWSGSVCLEAAGPVEVASHRADGSIPVDRGRGRTWWRWSDEQVDRVVTLSAPGLVAARVELLG